MEGVFQKCFLESNELWFLCAQFSPAFVIGFPNPMIGFLTSEIEIKTQEAISSLIKKQIISINNGKIKIDEGIKTLISVIAISDHVFLISYKENNSVQVKTSSFHFNNKRTVHLEEQENGQYLLQLVTFEDYILSLCTKPLQENIFWAPDSNPLYFHDGFINSLHELVSAGNIEEASKKLMGVDGDRITKLHLLETLQNYKASISLIGFYQIDGSRNEYVDGLSILAGERYLWLFELIDEKDKLVRASKISLKELKKRVELKIPHMENASNEI
jgi:hypothetical protein